MIAFTTIITTITAVIGIVMSIGLLLHGLINKRERESIFFGFLGLILFFSILHYLINTKFGKIKDSLAEKIELENEALRKKIEQKKLVKELKDMDEQKHDL